MNEKKKKKVNAKLAKSHWRFSYLIYDTRLGCATDVRCGKWWFFRIKFPRSFLALCYISASGFLMIVVRGDCCPCFFFLQLIYVRIKLVVYSRSRIAWVLLKIILLYVRMMRWMELDGIVSICCIPACKINCSKYSIQIKRQ